MTLFNALLENIQNQIWKEHNISC